MLLKNDAVIMRVSVLLFLLGLLPGVAQHTNSIKATLESETRSINIQQEFTYQNSSQDTLHELFFNDWTNAYSDKNTALAKRFAEDFKKNLHLAKPEERGSTQIFNLADFEFRSLAWKRTEEKDLISVQLNSPLPPGESIKNVFYLYR